MNVCCRKEEKKGEKEEQRDKVRDNSIFVFCRGKSALMENYSVSRAGLANIFCKTQIVNIFSFAGHKVSVATTQFYHCSVQTVTDNT